MSFDLNRLNLLIAVLQKRAGLNLSQSDIYLNIVGGLQIKEPAIDLAVAMAICSAHNSFSVPPNLALFGEIGLSGEIRSVSAANLREMEAKRLGYPLLVKSKKLIEAIKEIFPTNIKTNNIKTKAIINQERKQISVEKESKESIDV